MMQLACVKCLEIMGEAATHVSDQTKQLDPAIEWQKIKAFRNFSVHEYFNVSTHLVWKIIKNDLPDLKTAIRALLIDLQK